MTKFSWVVGCGVLLSGVAGCGNDTGTSAGNTDSSSSTGQSSQATEATATTPATATEGSATQGSATEGSATAASMTDPTVTGGTNPTTGMSGTTGGSTGGMTSMSGTTDSGTTGQVSSGSSGSGGSTGGGCPMPQQCGNEICCPDGQVCLEGQCQNDCGGPPPCGVNQECCAGGDICYLGQCVTPGDACMQKVCATLDQSDCPEGFFCDLDLKVCIPSQADLNCKYIPPNATFKPVPLFTWGTRTKVACQNASQCQTAEVCQAGTCTPTWPHLTIAANDMPMHNQSSSIAVVADLDRDCVPEIVFNTYRPGVVTSDGILRAIRGDNGAKVWTITDPAWRTESTSNPAIGDLDGDGNAEIVVQAASPAKQLLAFDQAGKPLWKSDTFNFNTVSAAISIANIDNDGEAEIVIGSAVFSSKGKKLYEGVGGIGTNGQGPISCIADLDGDGRQELIAGKVAHSFTGKVVDNSFAGKVLWTSSATDGFCGVADFNGDQKPEIILVSAAKVFALNGQTGVPITNAPIPNGGAGGPPNIADFDGDKVPDVAAAGSTRYIVYKFNGMAFTQLWTAVTDDTSSQVTGSSVFDFDGDGRAEVVYNDENYIRIYPGVEPDCLKMPVGPGCDKNMTDAEVLFRDKNSSRTRTEYPVIADVDGDFKAEMVSTLP